MSDQLVGFESFLKSYFESADFQASTQLKGKRQLYSAIRYSLFGGGKRFRPSLSLLAGELFQLYPQRVYPFAASLECIHTYSLIHDDLPCMDNDDFRRGRPTNHKVYSEEIALLAGDALISEAFAILVQHYEHSPGVALKLIGLLVKSIGPQGMVAGQALDLRSHNASEDLMNTIHDLKTGELITTSVVGVGLIAGCSFNELNALKNYGKFLGQAFQLADDLHDAETERTSNEASMLSVQDKKYVENLLKEKTEKAIGALTPFGERALGLIEMANYNLNRKN